MNQMPAQRIQFIMKHNGGVYVYSAQQSVITQFQREKLCGNHMPKAGRDNLPVKCCPLPLIMTMVVGSFLFLGTDTLH